MRYKHISTGLVEKKISDSISVFQSKELNDGHKLDLGIRTFHFIVCYYLPSTPIIPLYFAEGKLVFFFKLITFHLFKFNLFIYLLFNGDSMC